MKKLIAAAIFWTLTTAVATAALVLLVVFIITLYKEAPLFLYPPLLAIGGLLLVYLYAWADKHRHDPPA